jgi:DNA-binding transcriptional LysR family regulator
MDVSTRHLRYFMAVAEELHFGRAAARLYISQPSLSLQIRNLEEELGALLFDRSSRKVQLTLAGRTLAQEAPAALTALDRAVNLTRLAGTTRRLTIRLGYTPVAGFGALRAILEAAERSHPELTIDAHEFFSAEIPERVRAGDIDLGIALAPAASTGVLGEVMRVERVSALLSSHHRLASASVIAVSDLRDETVLLFPRHLAPAYYDGIIAGFVEAGFSPDVRAFEEPPVNAMISRLANGREVGLAPASFSEHAARVGTGLVHREVASPQIMAEFSMLWSATNRSPEIAGVIDAVREAAQRGGWL